VSGPGDDDTPPPGRLTGLAWVLIASIPVLVAILLIAGRGPVADAAFLGLALVVFVLATAVLGPPRRPRRERPWRR
jgi:TRAP-type uncharacterized transport system fused permease subunit